MLKNIREKIGEYLEKIRILVEIPGAFGARKAGNLDIYKVLYRLRRMGIDPQTVVDIGANRGVFTKNVHLIFPNARIYAFEPLKDCYDELSRLKETITSLFCYNVALAEKSGGTMIHRSSYDFSSSLLEMNDLHKEAFPYSAGERLEKVHTEKLDGILNGRILPKPVLMKIDVQGYEKYVLDGGCKTLQNTDYVICEMSFKPLYEGQALFDELYCQFVDAGFFFAGPVAELRHPKTSEVLQIDGLFIKGVRKAEYSQTL